MSGPSTRARRIGLIATLALGIGLTMSTVVHAVGTNWTLQTSAADNQWQSIAYGNGLFVAVASSGIGNRVMTSPDGVSWTARASAADNVWESVAFGDGLFVAVASTGAQRVMTSPDGINWTARNTPGDVHWKAVAHGNGRFIAVGAGCDPLAGAVCDPNNRPIMTSADGITWVLGPVGPAGQGGFARDWYAIAFGNGRFVAVADWRVQQQPNNQVVMTSTDDGVNWTLQNSSAGAFRSVAFGAGLFVALDSNAIPIGAGNRVMTSPDGVTWTNRTAAADIQWNALTYGEGIFVAVASSGDGNRIMTSPDGIAWTSVASPADNSWRSVAFGSGTFAAVSSTGFPNQVMISRAGVAADPARWTNVRQSLPLPASGECADIDDLEYAWGTGLSGGWQQSWEPWVNPTVDAQGNRIGGWACSRVLTNNGVTWFITQS